MLVTRDLIVRKADAAKPALQIAYGAVYVPDLVDSQGDFMRADEIRKAAHGFLRAGTTDAVDVNHNNLKSGCHIVESFITKAGDPDFPIEGTWVVGIHIPDADLWAAVQKGEIGGLSMEVIARRHNNRPVAERKLKGGKSKVSGCTYKTGDHEHTYELEFGPEGQILGGRTNEVDGHFHVIRAGKTGVVTDYANDHCHRFSTLEHFEFVAADEATVAAAKADAEADEEFEFFKLAVRAAAANGARARGSRPTEYQTQRDYDQTTRHNREVQAANRDARRLTRRIDRYNAATATPADSASNRHRRRVGNRLQQNSTRANIRADGLDRRGAQMRQGEQRAVEERRAAGSAGGRSWVRGFYRQTARGNRVWVRGHWAENN